MGLMNMESDPRPVVRPWKLFFSAKTKDFSADLNVQHRRHRSFLSFLPSKQHTSNNASVSISLRIRIHNLLLKIRIAAGKMKEMRILQRFHRFRKVTVLDVKSSDHMAKNCTEISAVPHILYNSPKWEGNGFVYGSICVGTFVFLLYRRCASILHFPVVCLMRAGTYIAGLIAKNKKSAYFVDSSSSLSARIWQGIKKSASLSRVVFSMCFPKQFAVTAILTIGIGLLLMRKSNNSMERKKKRMGNRLLSAMKLMRYWWKQVSMKHAVCLVVFVAVVFNIFCSRTKQ